VNRPRYLLALAWTLAWGTSRTINQLLRHITGCGDLSSCTARWRAHIAWAWVWGRWESPRPAHCSACGWRGPERWLVHTYESDQRGDVTPVDECPVCREEI
jgi:hypothetical protein